MEIVILIIAVVFIAIAFWGKQKKTKGGESYFLGASDSNVIQLTLTLSASWIGAASLLALSGWVQQFGAGVIWYLLFPSLGLVAISFFGVDFIRSRKGAALFDYYDNPWFKYTFSVFLAFVYTMILAAQFAGFAKLSSALGFSYLFGLLSCGFIIAIYTSIGGFTSVRDTDIAQFILIFIALAGFFFGMPYKVQFPDFAEILTPTKSIPTSMFLVFACMGLMMFVAQENHQRIKAAKDAKSAKLACFLAGVVVICFAIAVSVLASSIPKGDGNPLLLTLAKLNPALCVIVSLGFMGAALSTVDSALNISSYSFMRVIPLQYRYKEYSLTVVSALFGLYVAHNIPSVGTIIMICVNLYIGVVLPVILGAMLKVSKKSLAAVTLFCMVPLAYGYYSQFSTPGLYGVVFGMVALAASRIWAKAVSGKVKQGVLN